MFERAHRFEPNPRQQLEKRGIAGQVETHGQHVGEESNQALGIRVDPSSDGCPEHEIGRVGVAMDESAKHRQQPHEQRRSIGLKDCPESRNDIRAESTPGASAPFRVDRTFEIRNQRHRGRAVERLDHRRQRVRGRGLIGTRARPNRVIGILDGQVGKRRLSAGAKRVIRDRELLQKQP